MTRPTLVVFLGNLGPSPAEQMVDAARCAAALDTIDAAVSSGAVERAILATDTPIADLDVPGLTVDLDDGPFHFGRRLVGVVQRHRLTSVVYLGGGSVPLFTAYDFRALTPELTSDTAITNNRFSSDLIA